MKFEICTYTPDKWMEIEDFRVRTFEEGNDSLHPTKYKPDDIDGETWMCYIDGELASISVVESSHYTGDPDIACRVCRYHILRDYRHSHCGFRMLEHQIKWARERGYQIFYLTHDIKNKPLNALYQHKRKMTDPEAKQFFEADWFMELEWDQRFLFKSHPNSGIVQNVYVIKLQDPNYIWMPKESIIWNQ